MIGKGKEEKIDLKRRRGDRSEEGKEEKRNERKRLEGEER